MGCASSKDAAAVLPTAPTDGSPSKSRSTSPRQNADGLTAKTLKSAARSGADVLKLVPARVPGDLSAWASGLRDDRGRPEAMRFLGELSQARNDGIDIERASATWSTSSFTSYHGQLLSLAVQWGVAIEIERAIKKSARFCLKAKVQSSAPRRTL
jgi:hypothetical protein